MSPYANGSATAGRPHDYLCPTSYKSLTATDNTQCNKPPQQNYIIVHPLYTLSVAKMSSPFDYDFAFSENTANANINGSYQPPTTFANRRGTELKLPSMLWKDQIDNNKENNFCYEAHVKKSSGLDKVSKSVVKLMKQASNEKKTFAGKRTPFGAVTNANNTLKTKAEEKRILDEVHSKLSDMC